MQLVVLPTGYEEGRFMFLLALIYVALCCCICPVLSRLVYCRSVLNVEHFNALRLRQHSVGLFLCVRLLIMICERIEESGFNCCGL